MLNQHIHTQKPLVTSFPDLCKALEALHRWEKARVASLHDVWLQGAPSPDSIIRVPAHFDERKRQPGNVVKRIVFPTPLAQWIVDVSAARGMPLTMRQGLAMVEGKEDYGA